MLKPALTGGMALGILSAIPGLSFCNCVCCAWAIGGGILAAYLYVKGSPFPVTMGQGAGTGLIAGAIGGVVCSLFSIPLQLISTGGENQTMMVEQLREILAKNPEFPQEAWQSIEAFLMHDGSMFLLTVFSFFANIVFFSIFAMLGGAIGVALFEKRKPGNFQQDTLPPQPPAGMPPPDSF
jgi:hypothetical protein